jgi:putative ABC transport system permease protein
MFTNFLKVTLRNLYREKMYAIINIFGLSLAIACCIILGLYLRSELTYDRHNIKYKQIFRIVNEFNINNKLDTFAVTSVSLGPLLVEDYPEIKGFVRFMGGYEEILLKHDDKAFYWKNTYDADVNVFDIFTHDIIYGDPKTALDDPSAVAVSESFAKKYFGNTNPIGETISNDVGKSFKITLVFADLPENSHLKYDALFSIKKNEWANMDNTTVRNQMLYNVGAYTYLLLPEGYDVQAFKSISDSFFTKHMAEMGKSINATWRCWIQPLADIHFQSEVAYDLPTANKLNVYGFTAVALFILLVACINYMNMATARAAKRAKEVGMRKILGAGRTSLTFQFLGESVFFSLIALFIGIVFVELALNLTPINGLLGKPLTLNLSQEPVLFGWMILFSLAVGLISGIYPSLYLSSMLPLSALMKGNRPGKGNIRLRELLVLFQFIISVTVIASALLMALQMRYVSHKPLGFNKENKIIINLKGADLIDKMPTIKKELLKNNNILGMSTSDVILGQMTPINAGDVDNNDGVLGKTTLKHMSVGEDYIEVMGMQLVTGRDFSKKLLTDVGMSFIVNEAMVKKMGWKEPLGKRIQLGLFNGRVIGVVKDFHFASLHSPVEPFAMHKITPGEYAPNEEQRKNISTLLVINISGKEISRTLSFLQEKFAEFDPAHPLNYKFLDDTLNQLYLSEQHLMKLIGIFAGVCILISCMGLFGLAAFTTEQRTKEIGVRKVLGASTGQIIVMLARRILLLVLIGAVIASVIAYYAMDEWLTDFAYRIGINPLVFIFSAVAAMMVAFITVSLQSYKTAQANPVEALRYE